VAQEEEEEEEEERRRCGMFRISMFFTPVSLC
jgi:hypothetical protein